ncbi:LysR family transcriptional regulator [Streptomyces sp. NPDC048179]|uniref:LysR family transcriptional regulator n=1 Tax=Streptomyces sp. NPDC048179 TaxID=3365506 RepID=UPI0037196010
MAELETRELEYFLAVAEELHFGRAAARLSIAQPALSRAVQRIESRLGVQLLIRSSRHVALTPAGEALRDHARPALTAVSAAVRSARQAGDTQTALRLVLKPGGDAGLLSVLLAAYSRQPDALRVDIVFSGPTDRADVLRDGRADLGLLYAPYDDLTGLDHETLHIEDRVAVIPATHRLAQHTSLQLADLDGETLPRWKGAKPGDDDAGPEIADAAQLFHMITLGRAIAVLPRSLAQPLPAGLLAVRVTDAPTSCLVLAWNEHDRRPLLAPFIAAAVSVRPQARS